jgi:uncharacterized membrane protein YbhN (UPF0104 family)
MSSPPLVPATPNGPWWKQVIQVLITLTVLVVVFGFFIPHLADYRDVLDVIQDISPGEWLVLLALAGGVLVAYVFVLMAAMRGLRFGEGFVAQTTATAITNTIPAGGAFALPLQYAMYLSWGFTPEAVTAALLSAGVFDQLARLALPTLSVLAVALSGDAERWMWLAAGAGIVIVATAVVLLALLFSSETAARKIGGVLDRLVARALRLIGRGEVDMVGAVLQFRANVVDIMRHRSVHLLLTTVLNLGLMVSLFLASIRAVGISSEEVSAAWVIMSFALGRLLVMIPVSPGGLGVVDAGLISLLSAGWATGSPDHDLIAAGVLLFRGLTLIPPVLVGVGTWLTWRFRRKGRHDWQTVRRGEWRQVGDPDARV